MIQRLLILLLAIFGVTACSADTATLPLAEDKPTLLFFYTDT